MASPDFPFAAIVGQERMKRALTLALVKPSIGGVLVRGQKGTAKSTAIRALASILPCSVVSLDCPFHCGAESKAELCPSCEKQEIEKTGRTTGPVRMRIVELPLGATEDRLIGSIDLERAVKKGEVHFEPGILAGANGNILYVDEVNLLDDHLVDAILDCAAMGVNYVEREGLSFSHPARFVLIGSMNPEEGELRPQLLDRFGIVVDVEGEHDPIERAEIVRRRIEFENDATAFVSKYASATEELAATIVAARARAKNLRISDEALAYIARGTLALRLDGHRADIAIARCAIANAALRGSDNVDIDDIRDCAPLAVPHRMRRRPFEEASVGDYVLNEAFPPAASGG